MQELSSSVIKSLNWRYAVKKFDRGRKISAPDWEILENSLLLSPSAYGLQPWRFIVVNSPELRKQLTPASHAQDQIEDCSHLVVFTSRISLDRSYVEHWTNELSRIRQLSPDSKSRYQEMVMNNVIHGYSSDFIREWTAKQAYIALGVLLTAAAMLEIDTCPMEGIDPEQYDQILGLKESNYRTLLSCALGFRSEKDSYAQAAKARFSRDRMIAYR